MAEGKYRIVKNPYHKGFIVEHKVGKYANNCEQSFFYSWERFRVLPTCETLEEAQTQFKELLSGKSKTNPEALYLDENGEEVS